MTSAVARQEQTSVAWRSAAQRARKGHHRESRSAIEDMLRLAQTRPALEVVLADPATAGEQRSPLYRVWAAALFGRTIDAYDAVLCLHEARLDTDARAHTRIAFEHLVHFAWVVEAPDQTERAGRLHQHGARLADAHRPELAKYVDLAPGADPLARLGRPEVPAAVGHAPPTLRELCVGLDRTLAPGSTGCGPEPSTASAAGTPTCTAVRAGSYTRAPTASGH